MQRGSCELSQNLASACYLRYQRPGDSLTCTCLTGRPLTSAVVISITSRTECRREPRRGQVRGLRRGGEYARVCRRGSARQLRAAMRQYLQVGLV